MNPAILESQVSSDVLHRLREETAPAHRALEAASPLMDPALDGEGYRRYLRASWGFWKPVEDALAASSAASVVPDLESRWKAPLLITDLRFFGESPRTTWPHLEAPPFGDLEGAVGCLYVLEGSTLGGQFLVRHLSRALDLQPPEGLRFLASYGTRVGARWRDFRAGVKRWAEEEPGSAGRAREDRVIAGAQQTFEALGRWFDHCEVSR